MPPNEEEVIKLSIKPKTVKTKKLSDLKPTKDAQGGCRKSAGGNEVQGVITSAKKMPSG